MVARLCGADVHSSLYIWTSPLFNLAGVFFSNFETSWNHVFKQCVCSECLTALLEYINSRKWYWPSRLYFTSRHFYTSNFKHCFCVAIGPGSPDNVRAVMLTATSVVVMWDQSPSTDVTGYLISYSTDASYISESDRMRSVMVTGHSTTNITLTDLEENTPYTITVQSNSSGRLSAPSVVVSVTTLTDGK